MAVFLDRDGTIVSERYYLADPDRVELIPGAAAALRRFAAAGYKLVVVTNQSGIARGLYTLSEFEAVQRRIAQLLEAEDVALDGVYLCPHHPDFTGPCVCRKPGLALYRQAAEDLGIDFGHAVFIGDRLKDVLPAKKLGGRAILVRTGYGTGQERDAPPAIDVADDVGAAASLILERREKGVVPLPVKRRERGVGRWEVGDG